MYFKLIKLTHLSCYFLEILNLNLREKKQVYFVLFTVQKYCVTQIPYLQFSRNLISIIKCTVVIGNLANCPYS